LGLLDPSLLEYLLGLEFQLALLDRLGLLVLLLRSLPACLPDLKLRSVLLDPLFRLDQLLLADPWLLPVP
jgi:hypothetical protein